MPNFFPDLKSIQRLAQQMSTQQKPEKRYTGLNPKSEEELPEARKQLAQYMRTVWNDEVFAMEIELAVSEGDYFEKMGAEMRKRMSGILSFIGKGEQ